MEPRPSVEVVLGVDIVFVKVPPKLCARESDASLDRMYRYLLAGVLLSAIEQTSLLSIQNEGEVLLIGKERAYGFMYRFRPGFML